MELPPVAGRERHVRKDLVLGLAEELANAWQLLLQRTGHLLQLLARWIWLSEDRVESQDVV
jgi:hypothetical protein